MKAQWLLAITMLLLNRDCVSAPELTRRFEVSVRTFYRDFDAEAIEREAGARPSCGRACLWQRGR